MSRVTLQSPGLSFLAWLTVSVITAGDLREQEKSAFDVHIRPEAELGRGLSVYLYLEENLKGFLSKLQDMPLHWLIMFLFWIR